jgi:hypothetical protein
MPDLSPGDLVTTVSGLVTMFSQLRIRTVGGGAGSTRGAGLRGSPYVVVAIVCDGRPDRGRAPWAYAVGVDQVGWAPTHSFVYELRPS